MKTQIARHIEITRLLKERGHVEVDLIADQFQIAPQTARRDLNQICHESVFHRVHGGAIYQPEGAYTAYQSRKFIAATAKEKIGLAVSNLIPAQSSLIINIGTTTAKVAEAMQAHSDLTIFTNDLKIANSLTEKTENTVYILGGRIHREDGVISSEMTGDFLKDVRADYTITGAAAIDEEGMLLNHEHRETRLSRTMLDRGRKTILVADHTKFHSKGILSFGRLADINILITDKQPSENIQALCEKHKVDIVIA